MGIKSLSKFLRDKCPGVFEHVHISEYHFKKVAIDISLYLCNYKALYGDDGWLRAFIRLIACLRENEVHCVFIYDTSAPPEKDSEKKDRRDNREKMEERVFLLEQAIEDYRNTGIVPDILVEFEAKRKLGHTNLLKGVKSLNIEAIEYAVTKMRKQLFTISEKDFETTRELFDILDVPYFMANMEAETTCADLCIQGKVDAVLSEDTDVLAYGSPVFLTKMNTGDATCMRIRYDKVLEELELTPEQFIDFCIMCGTDYNKNIFKVGPAKAYAYIKKYGSIEEVGKQTNHDISILNHIRSRELFRNYNRSNFSVPYCGHPNFSELEQFVFRKNVRMNIDSLRKAFVHNLIVFEN
jgi:flap endonuclease-1